MLESLKAEAILAIIKVAQASIGPNEKLWRIGEISRRLKRAEKAMMDAREFVLQSQEAVL